jgi:iron complex transport system substrate-binding protein
LRLYSAFTVNLRPLALALLWGLSALSSDSQTPLKSFPLSRSTTFSIDYYQGFKLATVKSPWPGSSRAFSYLLYRRGGAKPEARLFPEARRIETPVRRVATFSTSYLPAITSIGEADSVVGVDAAVYVNDPAIRARLSAGSAVEVTKNSLPDIERIIALSPDAIFTYGMGNEWDTHPKLVEAGLPVVMDGEWNEVDPLARAEWVVFIAAFYDKEDQAEAWFKSVEGRYLELKTRAAAATSAKPRVLNNGPFQGTWTVSGGGSFMARLIADAGGTYLWADTKDRGGIVLSVEAVYERALKADIWINPAYAPRTVAEVIALDPRFSSLPVVKSGKIWNNNLRLNGVGGNDYFESAVIRPDAVLADLIAIFHPELDKAHAFSWFRKLDR